MNTLSDTSIFDSDDLLELDKDLLELDKDLLELDKDLDCFECKGCSTTYCLESSLMRHDHLRQKEKCRKLHPGKNQIPEDTSSPVKTDQARRPPRSKNDDVPRRRDTRSTR